MINLKTIRETAHRTCPFCGREESFVEKHYSSKGSSGVNDGLRDGASTIRSKTDPAQEARKWLDKHINICPAIIETPSINGVDGVVNFTTHPIKLYYRGEEINFPPSGKIIRVEEKPVGSDGFFSDYEMGKVELPPPFKTFEDASCLYIVSKPVAMVVKRDDVYFPDNLVRDETGKVIACEGLGRIVRSMN